MVNETTTPGKNGSANIFRQQAIDALNEIDSHDATYSVSGPATWLLLLTCTLLAASVTLWFTLGEISLTDESTGIVISKQQMTEAEALLQQTLNNRKIDLEEQRDLYEQKRILYQKHYLTRPDLFQARQAYLMADKLYTESKNNLLNPWEQTQADTSFIALTFIDYTLAKRIHLDMPAKIYDTLHPHRFYTARVIGITKHPASEQLMSAYLNNNELVNTFHSLNAKQMVKLALDDTNLPANTPIMTKITYNVCTPLKLISKGEDCG